MSDKNKSKLRNTFITPSVIKYQSTEYRYTTFYFDNIIGTYDRNRSIIIATF